MSFPPSSRTWVVRVIRSCRTTEQIRTCREWIESLRHRRELEAEDERALKSLADVYEGELAGGQWARPSPGAPSAPALL